MIFTPSPTEDDSDTRAIAIFGVWLLACTLVGALSLVTWFLACYQGDNSSRIIADGSIADHICDAYGFAVEHRPAGWLLVVWPATLSTLIGIGLFLRERFTWWSVGFPLILWLAWTIFVMTVRSAGSVAV